MFTNISGHPIGPTHVDGTKTLSQNNGILLPTYVVRNQEQQKHHTTRHHTFGNQNSTQWTQYGIVRPGRVGLHLLILKKKTPIVCLCNTYICFFLQNKISLFYQLKSGGIILSLLTIYCSQNYGFGDKFCWDDTFLYSAVSINKIEVLLRGSSYKTTTEYKAHKCKVVQELIRRRFGFISFSLINPEREGQFYPISYKRFVDFTTLKEKKKLLSRPQSGFFLLDLKLHITNHTLIAVLYLFPLKFILHHSEFPPDSISSPSCLYSSSRRFPQIVQGKHPVCKHITVNKTA